MISWKKLSTLSRADQIKLQAKQWQYFNQHILPYQPFFRELSKKNKFDASQIEALPFSSKSDILPTTENPGRPRDFILQPDEKLVRQTMARPELLRKLLGGKSGLRRQLELEFKPIHIHFTTGRSSAQIPFFYSRHDLDRLAETGRRIVDIIGASSDEIVVNAFPYAPHLAFWQAYMATTSAGLLALQSGGGKILTTNKIMDSIERMKATLLIIMPGYGYHLLREAVEQKRDFSSLKFVVMGGERVNPGLREKMKEMLADLGAKKVKVLSTYAMTEGKGGWVQCHEDSGYHLYPDLEYIELIDDNGKPVEPGQPGEIVYTALDWRGTVVTRYRTGDMAKGLMTEPCKYCGRTVPQLHSDIERKSENVDLMLTKVKGELVNLNSFHTLIHQVSGIDEWQVEIGKKNNDPHGLDELHIHLALLPDADEKVTVAALQKLIQAEMGIGPLFRVHDRTTLIDQLGLETNLKEKRIIDRRKDLL